jgi:hypothetical protein
MSRANPMSCRVQHAVSLVRWLLNLFPDAAPRPPLREDRLPDDELLCEHQ